MPSVKGISDVEVNGLGAKLNEFAEEKGAGDPHVKVDVPTPVTVMPGGPTGLMNLPVLSPATGIAWAVLRQKNQNATPVPIKMKVRFNDSRTFGVVIIWC